MAARPIRFASQEHQGREIHALHVHHSADDGRGLSYYGNGQTVLVVGKARGNRYHKPICEVLGEQDSAFCYTNFFLPEELS